LECPWGLLTVAPAHRDDTLRLARAGSGWRLSGTAARVPWGGAASHLVIVTEAEGRTLGRRGGAAGARGSGDRGLALRRPGAVGADGGWPRLSPAPGRAVRDRAAPVWQADRLLPGDPAEPGRGGRAHGRS